MRDTAGSYLNLLNKGLKPCGLSVKLQSKDNKLGLKSLHIDEKSFAELKTN